MSNWRAERKPTSKWINGAHWRQMHPWWWREMIWAFDGKLLSWVWFLIKQLNNILIMSAMVQLWLWKYSLPFPQKENKSSEKNWYLLRIELMFSLKYYHHLGEANTHRNLFLTQAKHPYVSTSMPWLTNDIFGNACTHIFNWTSPSASKKAILEEKQMRKMNKSGEMNKWEKEIWMFLFVFGNSILFFFF